MKSGFSRKRFGALNAGLAAFLLALPPCARGAMPPLGYTGPAPRLEQAQTASADPGTPPVGFVGDVPKTWADVKISGPSAAAPPVSDHAGETLITALRMHSDNATGIMTATGKVEIVHNDYVLHADRVTYNQKTGIMTADGHVAILTPSGEVEFADHEEITGDMKQAFARNIGILFPDNSRMAAAQGRHYDERYSVAEQAAYTACNVCKEHPEQPPLWQLRAGSMTHDNEEHQLYYHDVTIDFADVPIAYTPYLSTPDPTVKRRQGFLSPMPGYSPMIGPYIRTPYYVDIAPDKDLTIAPTFSEIDKAQLAAQYRERFARGDMNLSGSITKADLIDETGIDKGMKWRGNMFGTAVYDLDNTWRTGTDIQYVSDKSYLHRYGLSSLDQTVDRGYVEGFKGRDYMAVNTYYLQDLRPGVNVAEPVVTPSLTLSALGDPGRAWGGRWSFDANTLTTMRDNAGHTLAQQGPETRRLSLNSGWERQFISNTGLVTTVSGLTRSDSYWADNVIDSNQTTVYDHVAYTRPFAQANIVSRYPMARGGDGYQQLLEPIVAVTAAPDVRQIAKQPIEDSLDVEFDETNLFSPNRFTGSDLIEGGSRVTYGLRNAMTTPSGARIDVFGGESYDFTGNSLFPDQSGLSTHASDYVGRIDFAPAEWINANYGFRLAQDNLSPQRQDAQASLGVPLFRPYTRYIQAYQTNLTTGAIGQVRQITLGFSSKFAKYWSLTSYHTQAFDPQPGPRNTGLMLGYTDECFAFGLTASRDDTSRADISSGTSVAFHFFLKNLGGIHTDSASNIAFPAEFRQTE